MHVCASLWEVREIVVKKVSKKFWLTRCRQLLGNNIHVWPGPGNKNNFFSNTRARLDVGCVQRIFSPPTIFPLAFNYDSQVSLVREIWRRCLSSGKQRRDDSNFLNKSGSQIPGMGLFQSTLCVPRDLLTDFELTIDAWSSSFDILKEIYRAKKRKILFHLERSKTFFAPLLIKSALHSYERKKGARNIPILKTKSINLIPKVDCHLSRDNPPFRDLNHLLNPNYR